MPFFTRFKHGYTKHGSDNQNDRRGEVQKSSRKLSELDPHTIVTKCFSDLECRHQLGPSESLLVQQKWEKLLRRFQKYGSFSGGNEVRLYDNGDELFDSMFAAIDSAKKRVWMEVYIFDDSPLAQEMVERIRKAAERGVEVIMLLDWVGSLSFKNTWYHDLIASHAKISFFNPPPFTKPLAFRNHRKTTIIDDTAFVGSMNVSEDAAGTKWGNNFFYDIQARIDGPAVRDLGNVFRDSLQEAGASFCPNPLPPVPPRPNGVYLQVLQSNVCQGKRHIQDVLQTVLNEASLSVTLTTGYFIPPGFLRRALIGLSNRKIPLSMLLSGKSDAPGALPASMHAVRKCLKRSDNITRVHLTQTRNCHAKTLIVDSLWSSIGSFNWDRYSSRRNLEVEVGIFDPNLAKQLEGKIHEERKNAKEITSASLKRHHQVVKCYWAIAYALGRLAGKNIMDGLSNRGQTACMRRTIVRSYLEGEAAPSTTFSLCSGFR